MADEFNTKRDITHNLCNRNFGRLRKRHGDILPSQDISQKAFSLAVTHTFADSRLSKIFPSTAMDISRLYARRWLRPIKDEREGVGPAHEVDLYQYVFAYHGIHDSHYARDLETDLVVYPVGVFISTDYENRLKDQVDQVNATYRDLVLVKERPYSQWFLCSEHAREPVALETVSDHMGDFWRYWGDPSAPSFNFDQHWIHLFKFHFYIYVPANAMNAIIWPARRIRGLDGNEDSVEPLKEKLLESVRAAFPNLHIYIYEIPPHEKDTKNSVKKAFAEASIKVARMIVESFMDRR